MSNKSSRIKLSQMYLIHSFPYLLDPKPNRAAHSPENGGELAKGNSRGAFSDRHSLTQCSLLEFCMAESTLKQVFDS